MSIDHKFFLSFKQFAICLCRIPSLGAEHLPLGYLISSEQEMNKILINMGDGKQSLLGSHILPENLILVDCGQSSILESLPMGVGMG